MTSDEGKGPDTEGRGEERNREGVRERKKEEKYETLT